MTRGLRVEDLVAGSCHLCDMQYRTVLVLALNKGIVSFIRGARIAPFDPLSRLFAVSATPASLNKRASAAVDEQFVVGMNMQGKFTHGPLY